MLRGRRGPVMMRAMNVGQSANKKGVLEELLGLGMVLVALDARAEGVTVPDHLDHDPQLRLNLSYRFGLPLSIDPWGISATLTFGGVPHECRFPWKSVFLLVSHVNGEPYLFPDDVPQELLSQAGIDGAWQLHDSILPSAPARPKLSLLSDPDADDSDVGDDDDDDGDADDSAEISDADATTDPEDPERRTTRPAPAALRQPRGASSRPRPSANKPVVPREVPQAADDGDDDDTTPPPAPSQGRQRGHLRVIK